MKHPLGFHPSDEESVGWVYSLEAGRGIDIMVGSM